MSIQNLSGDLSSSDGNNPTRSGSYYDDHRLDDLTVGQTVQINLDGSFDTYLQLVNAATGQVISFDDDGGPGLNSELSFTVQSGVNYLVRATSFGSGATGTYSLTTTQGDLEAIADQVSGDLSSSDGNNPTRSGSYYDDHRLDDLTVGQTVQINLDGSFDTYLQLVNAATGQVISFDDDGGPGLNSELSFTVQSGVNYLVRATSFGSGATGTYSLTTTQGDLEAIADQVSGDLSSSDGNNPTRSGSYYDDHRLDDLTVGQTVQINLDGSFDTYLQLVNAATGQVISFDDDGGPGLNSELSFTVQSGVNYLVRATSFGSGATGTYSLTTTQGDLEAIADQVSGDLSSSDGNNPTRSGSYYDDHRLDDLTVGQTVQINLDGSFDTYLQLVNAATGQVISFDDDGGPGLNSELSFTVQSGVNYLVRATSFGSGATGTYSLTTTQGDLEAIADQVSGDLSSSDGNNPTRSGSYYDDYRLDDLTVGQTVQINLDGSFDTYLQLVNAATGQVISFDDDGGPGLNSELSFTVQSGVNYLVRATSFGSGATGTYSLTTTQGDLEAIADVSVPNTYLPFDSTQVFNLNSNSDADHIIYLDFDGHTTNGTLWNNSYGNNIVTAAYDTDGNTASFSNAELETIWRIWQRVSEDFSPFDVNVTTAAPSTDQLINSGGSDTQWGVRVSIGGDGSWYGSAGGVAYLDSFNWYSDTPTFVFEDNLGNGNEKFTAEAISHEVGHTLGLSHDGTSTVEYYQGHGSGETGWAPILGVGYYSELTQWSQGEYSDAENQEDDLAIITSQNGFGYRVDDYGDNSSSAAALSSIGGVVENYGIIETNNDSDWFSFTTTTGNIDLDINAFERGANLDILAELYNSAGQFILGSNPVGNLSASISTTLGAGQYFLSVTGTGEGNPLGTGYSDYGSLGQYSISGTIV
ncbi:hypothetical protein WJM97_10305 [Okeanomitos corallinicola TIOX110]|uniref:Peptidase C-terminal archaeal/bacterial domain-containing protein n=1 Tax=Okeanomitos corallinicola TIOX110 TaxID=3133117 RepID=A0ABZ2V0F4_9CYAN